MSEVLRLMNIARGCHDYGGGYHEERAAEIYHHGIQTVINALEAALTKDDFQLRTLERIGSESQIYGGRGSARDDGR